MHCARAHNGLQPEPAYRDALRGTGRVIGGGNIGMVAGLCSMKKRMYREVSSSACEESCAQRSLRCPSQGNVDAKGTAGGARRQIHRGLPSPAFPEDTWYSSSPTSPIRPGREASSRKSYQKLLD